MVAPATANSNPVFLAYVAVFTAATVACFASVRRARSIEDPDTRRGLVWLLLTSGGWSLATVAFLVVPGETLKVAAHQVGLVVGLATVGPWLYFCSAYTGRNLHRNRTLRRLALGVYLAFVALKLTNPLHGLYFETAVATSPFEHLAVRHLAPHWVAMGLSYALATVGYFMLLELFVQVDYDARPLAVLGALTGMPIAFDLLGRSGPWLLEVTYEPLGVAVFAVGVLFVYVDQFKTVRLASDVDDPVVVLDEDGNLRDANRSATDLFPALADGQGEPLGAVAPALADCLDDDEDVLVLDRGGERRYYLVSPSPFEAGGAQVGSLVVIRDVTEAERYRRELEAKTEQLEQFASVVAHDLRNPLNVAQGQLAVEREDRDSEALSAAAASLDDMESLIDDLLTLAREGQTIDDPGPVSLAATVERCEASVDLPDGSVVVAEDVDLLADPERLGQLLGNLLRNAREHAGDDVTVTVGPLEDGTGFFVEDDGPGIPPEERDDVLEPGVTSTPDGTGFGLAIVSRIADAHGWTVDVTEGDEGGARFEFAGVQRPSRSDGRPVEDAA